MQSKAAILIFIIAAVLIFYTAEKAAVQKPEAMQNAWASKSPIAYAPVQSPPPSPISYSPPPGQNECSEGDKRPCTTDGCAGTSYCLYGKFAQCVRNEPVCSPGATAPCSSDSCSFGVRRCNACGDGWGGCLPK